MDNVEIFKFMEECGCCTICCLRFIKARGEEYNSLQDSLKKLGLDYIHIEKINQNENDEMDSKKRRKNHCIACLDLFSNLSEEILTMISDNPRIKEYDCNEFVLALSLPILLNIRQLSLWIALAKKFGDNKFDQDKPPDMPLKEVFKLIMGPKLSKKLNKDYNPNGIMINIVINHADEENDIKKLMSAGNSVLKQKISRNQKKCKELTRGYFDKNFILNNINFNIYEKYVSVPPNIPSSSLILENITFTGPTVFVAGRYRKFSRYLSHSPWILQGKRIMEDSIQEIIIRTVSPHFKVSEENIIFSSSGREDVDVRCLGDGRPFVLEISDSRIIKLPINIAKEIELDIERSNILSVHNLQLVKREELVHLKTGEEYKKKIYRALCVLEKPVSLEILMKLNMPNGFITNQITPIRVLHRRPLHNRPRTIYSVKGYVSKTNSKVVILDVITQAGTYIKELVHGEFGRTHPSISSILGLWIDIIALDVTAVELDWPKRIDNRADTQK